MTQDKLRQRLAIEAARLIFRRQEADPYRATLRAARSLFRGWVKPDEFPSEAEIRLHLQQMSWMHDSDVRFDNLTEVLGLARTTLTRLARFHARLAGSAAAGQCRHLRQIRINAFCDDPSELIRELGQEPALRLHAVRHQAGRPFTRTMLRFPGPIETVIVCYPDEYWRRPLRRISTGQRLPELTLPQVNERLAELDPDHESPAAAPGNGGNRFAVYRMLLAPLANVQQPRSSHPEGDALYHSLQVFELARQESPYDEEFLLAALLHDVGKAIDPMNHVLAGLAALDGHVTERTSWLIANHHDAHRLRSGTLGQRARRRLRESPDYDDLITLSRCDDAGRVPGGTAPDIDTALDYIRGLVRMCGETDD